MLITVCDAPEHYKPEITNVGGVVVREWGGLMDVQFKDCRMRVGEDYVRIWKPHTINEFMFDQSDFSNIYIQ